MVSLKSLRNSLADPIAGVVLRVPALEPGFRAVGQRLRSVPILRKFYPRCIETLCKKWKERGMEHRAVEIGGLQFIFDVTDFTMLGWYFHRQLFEPETTRLMVETIQPGQTVLDIGANRGYMSMLAGKRVGKNGRVFSFEPNPTIYRALVEHVHLNGLQSVVFPSTLALSNRRAENATFYLSNLEANSGLSSLTPIAELLEHRYLTSDKTISVQTDTLDGWLAANRIGGPIDFIKIDVEGAEMLVLEGAATTLSQQPPKRWVIETSPASPAIPFLKEFDYEVKALDPAGSHSNFLFTHASYQ